MITLTFLKYKDRAISRLETLNEIDLKTFNILKYMISLRVDEISKTKKNIDIDIDGKFSVYTRRIFKDYIFETV